MPVKWIVFVLSLWIVLGVLGGIVEQSFFTAGRDSGQGTLNTLMSFRIFTSLTGSGWIPIPIPNLEWFNALKTVATFDFVFFQNPAGQIIRWIMFLPLGIAMGISFVLALVRGTGST